MEVAPISLTPRHLALLTAVMLVVALVGGGAGALVGARLVAPPRALATVVSVPTVAAAPDRATAVAAAMQGIVTILADLPPRANAQGERTQTENIGSGIVIHEGGLVLTNFHVIFGAAELTVVLSTGERRAATYVADDSPFHDMAVLRVQGGGLRALPLGDSSALRPGDSISVVSSGLVTFENQVKSGIISTSGLDFPRPGVVLQDMLQTDAAVNHGDSGGALLNDRGQVVGLVTTVVRQTPNGDTVEGVGLAHSINSLRPAIDAVLQTGANPRPRLGIERLNQHHVPIDRSKLPPNSPYADGVAIVAVDRGSPAESAGIRIGDVITAVNGQPIEGLAPFVNLLGASPAGRDVQLSVFRDGRQRAVTVTPRAVGASR